MLGFPRNQHAKICADPFVEGPCVVIRILTHIFRTPLAWTCKKETPTKAVMFLPTFASTSKNFCIEFNAPRFRWSVSYKNLHVQKSREVKAGKPAPVPEIICQSLVQ